MGAEALHRVFLPLPCAPDPGRPGLVSLLGAGPTWFGDWAGLSANPRIERPPYRAAPERAVAIHHFLSLPRHSECGMPGLAGLLSKYGQVCGNRRGMDSRARGRPQHVDDR